MTVNSIDNTKNQNDEYEVDGVELGSYASGVKGRMTYRLEFSDARLAKEQICLWQCESAETDSTISFGAIRQIVLLPSNEMDIVFNEMDDRAIEAFENTENLYWGIYRLVLMASVFDTVDWNVDAVLMEHEGCDEYVSFSIEVYRDPDAFMVEVEDAE